MKEIEKITRNSNTPQEELEEVKVIYSDSGFTKAILQSPLLEKYSSEEQEKLLFPQGLKVTFYKPGNIPESQMTARYGVLDIRGKKLEVRNKVVFINFMRRDTINTEQLNWSQDSSKIYTDKMVYIKSKDGLFKSNGMVSNETFTNYRFFKVSGIATFNLDNGNSDTIQ